MFKDSHEATRNVGMMGVVLAVLVLIGLYGLGAAFVTGMGLMEGDGASLEVYVERLDQDLKKAGIELKEEEALSGKWQGYQGILKEIEALDQEREVGGESLQAARLAVDAVRDELEAEVSEFEKYRDHYRDVERTRAEGEMVDLSATQGEGFESCKILGVNPLFLKVMTSAGPVGVEYQKLPGELQDRFQFSKDEAAEYREWLKVQGEKRDERMAEFREKQKVKKAEEAVEYRKREIEALQLGLQKAENQVVQYEAEAKRWDGESIRFTNEANQARREGRVTSKFGLATQAKRKANGFRNQAQALRARMTADRQKIAKLQVEAKE